MLWSTFVVSLKLKLKLKAETETRSMTSNNAFVGICGKIGDGAEWKQMDLVVVFAYRIRFGKTPDNYLEAVLQS